MINNSRTNTAYFSVNNRKINLKLEDLQDQIVGLRGLGKYLSVWDCTTGLPETDPPEMPYTYQTGDYYRIKKIATAEGEVNYQPSGTVYDGTPSTVVSTEPIAVGDIFVFDGTVWSHQPRSLEVDDHLDPNSINPVQNRVIYSVIGTLADEIDAL